MSDIPDIKRVLLGEKTDRMRKLDMLVRQGMMSPAQLPMLHRGLEKLQAGKQLAPTEIAAVAKVMDSLMYIVTGDDTVFQKARQHTQKNRYQTEDIEDGAEEDVELDIVSEAYKTGHKSYTDAVNHAFDHHAKSGLTSTPDHKAQHVGLDSKRPGSGKTTRVNIPATHKSGKKHMVHMQVFNKGGSHPYELNTYSSTSKKLQKEEVEQVDELKKSTLSSYIQKAADPVAKKSNVNLASKAAHKLATSDDMDAGEKEDRKAFVRSKGIQTAAKKLAKEEAELDEKVKDMSMGEVIKDFQDSDAPQFKGKSKEKKREMAIAAKLSSESYASDKEEMETDPGAKAAMKVERVTPSRAKYAVKKGFVYAEEWTDDELDALFEMDNYKAKFQAMLKKTGKTLASMSDEEKKKFFTTVDAAHKAKNEDTEIDEAIKLKGFGKDAGPSNMSNPAARASLMKSKPAVKKKVSDMTPDEKESNTKRRKEYNDYQKSKRGAPNNTSATQGKMMSPKGTMQESNAETEEIIEPEVETQTTEVETVDDQHMRAYVTQITQHAKDTNF